MSMRDYAEILSEAIDIIVAQRISEIAQDETVICTIVDDSDKENGHYKVAPNDAVIYDAYTDITTYGIDARVYVLTPKDGSPRTIVSRYLGDEASSPIEYVSPAKTIIPQGNPLKIEKLEQGQNIYLDIPSGTKNYNAIYISAEFLAPFNGNLAGSPWYGLVLTGINTKTKQVRTFIFDSAQMFGDPFNFMGYFKQEQGFVYSITEDFDELYLSLQTTGISGSQAQQIVAQNISIQFGIETTTAIKNQIELITTDSLVYDPDQFQKTISLLWYNLDGNKYIGFEDGVFDAEKAQNPQNDSNIYYAIEWYRDNKDGSLELLPATGDAKKAQTITVTCDTSKASQKIQAILWRNGVQYKAEIEFSNSIVENITPPEIAGLEIDLIHGEKSLDVYPLYGVDNLLIDPADQYLARNIQFTWRTDSGIVNPEYWEDATIYWYLPMNATMLKAAYSNKGLTQLETSDKEGYLCYVATDPATHNLFAYSISDFYNIAFTNNTIICVVKKGARTWEAKKTLTFSSFGASGTDYAIAFSIDDGAPGFINGVHNQQRPLKITAQLYSPEGEKVEGEIKTWEITSYDLADPLILDATMKAEWLGEQVTLTASYPVAYLGSQNIYASVPTTIVYDNLGTTANYYSGEMQVFNKLDHNSITAEWSAFYANINDQKFLPQVKDARLFVPSLYVSGTGKMAVQAKTGNEILWYQPLVIAQNKYASQFLNNWDGSLEVDNDNNYIMAKMIGAGRKDKDNTFSGVLMGDVGKKGGTTNTGLYGYHKGAQSFGFNTDGTAFIGKAGKGRILFDGNESTIKSANWETTQKGTYMDLDNANLQLIGDKGSLKFVNGKLELQLESFNMIMGGSGSNNQTLDKYIENSATNIADSQIQTSISASNGAIHLAIVDTAGQTLQEANAYAEQQAEAASSVAVSAQKEAEEAAKLANDAKEAGVILGQNYAILDATVKGIEAEVSHSASYFGTCSTPGTGENSHIKVIDLPVPAIAEFNYDHVFTKNRTIAIQFAYSEQPTDTVTTSYIQTIVTEKSYTPDTYYIKSGDSYALATGKFSATADYYYAVSTSTKVGRELYLKINDKTHKIYINGEVTGASNPFGWIKGNVVYFTYQGADAENGYWLVSDCGSYSNVLQTAYAITSSVSSLDGKFSSQILQTSTEIRSEVSNLDTSLSSSIAQTADSIRQEIINGDTGVTTAFQVADGVITQSIIDKEAGLYQKIESTEKGINESIGLIAADVEGLDVEIDKLKLSPIVYYCEGDYEDDRTEWTLTLHTQVASFKTGDIVQVQFLSDKSLNSDNELIQFMFRYYDDEENEHFIGGSENPTKFDVRGDYLRWLEGETLAFVYAGDTFLLTYVSQSQIEKTATAIATSVSSVRGYAALIYDYDYVELDPSLATCLFRAEFSPEVQITTLPTGTIIALKCDEALSLEEWEKCQGDISIWFQQDATQFGPFRTKDTPHWLEGDEVYFMLTVDMAGDPYLRPTSPISTAQTEMLSDMISARVVNGATGNGFGWNLDAESFTLQASVTDASGTTTQTEVLKCDANGLTVTGTINALNGTIGGWTINEYKITGGESKDECCVMQVPNYVYGYNTDGTAKKTKWVFAAGSESHDAYGDAPFRVDKNGNLYMSAAYVSGGKIYFGSNNNCNLQWKNSRLQVNDANFWAREITANTLTCTEGFKFLGSAVGARTVTIGGTSYTILTI